MKVGFVIGIKELIGRMNESMKEIGSEFNIGGETKRIDTETKVLLSIYGGRKLISKPQN